jgi:UDP-GlcNAc:undecaprenyl-phosphate GlcNAc-1-phosphate transferase
VTDSLFWALGSFLLAFAISWLLCWGIIRLAPRLGLVDLPGERKVHTHATPRGGGLAIYLAVVVTAAALGRNLWPDLLPSLIAGFFIVTLGLIDDLRPLPWQLRLGVQTITAAVVIFLWHADLSWPAQLAAIFWLVALINAFNMLDNMDALSAGVAWITAGLLAVGLLIREEKFSAWLPVQPNLMLMGALTGFLWFNWPPARLFMGDAGSTFLGFFLGLRSLRIIGTDQPVSQTWAVLLCIFAVPLYDMTSVVVLRLWQGRSPFHADKQHLSHRLVMLGLSSPLAVRVIYLLGLASGLGGLVLWQCSGLGALFLAIQIVCLWLAIAAVEYFRHFRAFRL